MRTLNKQRRTHETKKLCKRYKPYTKMQFKLHARTQQQDDPETEDASVANISEDVEPFQVKSFRCDICDEVFETEEQFLEHTFSHQFLPPIGLFAGQNVVCDSHLVKGWKNIVT